MADAASLKLPRRIPYQIAIELLFTGRLFDAAVGGAVGAGEPCAARRRPDAGARAMADDLAAGPRLVFAAIKEIVRVRPRR